MSATPERAVVLEFGADDSGSGADPGDWASATLASQQDRPVLGLYRSPWEAFLGEPDVAGCEEARQWLAAWCRFHRDLLACYRQSPDRVLLVNAGCLADPAPLVEHLRASGIEPPPQIAGRGGEAAQGELSRLLASGLAGVAPEAWAIYEELESCALLLGREPEFQATCSLADPDDAGELMAAFAQLQSATRAAIRDACAETDRNRIAEAEAAGEIRTRELRQENELIASQLQQVLEELHYQVESGKDLRALLVEAGNNAEAARMLISRLAGRVPLD